MPEGMTNCTFRAPLLCASDTALMPSDSGTAAVTMLLTSFCILSFCSICKAGLKGPHLQSNMLEASDTTCDAVTHTVLLAVGSTQTHGPHMFDANMIILLVTSAAN